MKSDVERLSKKQWIFIL